MKHQVSKTKKEMGVAAARAGADRIRAAIASRGHANIIVATGASQFEMLDSFITEKIEWHKVTAFHLDEYVGLPITHPASFRNYLWERFVRRLPLPLKAFHYLDAEKDAAALMTEVNAVIARHPIDVAFVGIGENGHLAFNDPPADFETEQPYIVVKLDDACRRQQVGEGWFKGIDDVPTHAVSMSVKQIIKSTAIVCSVPDERKARAVRSTIEGPVTASLPASILQRHKDTIIFLDQPAASLLRENK